MMQAGQQNPHRRRNMYAAPGSVTADRWDAIGHDPGHASFRPWGIRCPVTSNRITSSTPSPEGRVSSLDVPIPVRKTQNGQSPGEGKRQDHAIGRGIDQGPPRCHAHAGRRLPPAENTSRLRLAVRWPLTRVIMVNQDRPPRPAGLARPALSRPCEQHAPPGAVELAPARVAGAFSLPIDLRNPNGPPDEPASRHTCRG